MNLPRTTDTDIQNSYTPKPQELFSPTGSPRNQYGSPISRLFMPEYSHAHYRVPKNKLIAGYHARGISVLQKICPRSDFIALDFSTIVIRIDGACRNSGTLSACAAWGVYFGYQSPHNICDALDSKFVQTRTRAEVEALAQALWYFKLGFRNDKSIRRVIFATDSYNIVNAMSKYIAGWVSRNGINEQGEQIAYFKELRIIHLDLTQFSQLSGMSIQFMLVSQEENKPASEFANRVLGI